MLPDYNSKVRFCSKSKKVIGTGARSEFLL